MKKGLFNITSMGEKYTIKRYNRYCGSCSRCIDEYEYIKYDGLCENCWYCRH